VTADAWPRFGSQTVSLSVLIADNSSVVLNMLCGFLCLMCDRGRYMLILFFFVNTFYIKT